jgi:hypothetical protein
MANKDINQAPADAGDDDAPSEFVEKSDDELISEALADLGEDDDSDGGAARPAGDGPENTEQASAPGDEKATDAEQPGDGDKDKGESGESKPDGGEEDGTKKEDGPRDRSWAAIRRKEQELVDARAAFKKEQEAISVERESYKKLGQAVQEMQAQVRTNPLQFLERQGWTMDALVKMALGQDGGKPSPAPAATQKPAADTEHPLAKEVRELRNIIERQAEDRILADYRVTVRNAIQGKDYELLAGYQAMAPDGTMLDAAGAIEHRASIDASNGDPILTPQQYADRLLSEYREALTKQASHSAVRKALGLGEIEPPPVENGNGASSKPNKGTEPTNLTNSLQGSPQRPKPAQDPDFTDEEAWISKAAELVVD